MPGKKFHGYIDAHAPAPLAARPDMWANLIEGEARDGYGFILKGRVNDIGYQSICAPANLQACTTRRTREHGACPGRSIVEPAIHWAENGWTVRPHVHFWWADDGALGRAPNHERTGFTPAARALYCRPDGAPKRVGDCVVNRDYGQTLRADRQGRRRRLLLRRDRRTRSPRTCAPRRPADASRTASSGRPCATRRCGATIAATRVSTNQPPGGGVMLIEMLNILEKFDLGALGHNSAEYMRIVAEAMKRATIDKDAACRRSRSSSTCRSSG